MELQQGARKVPSPQCSFGQYNKGILYHPGHVRYGEHPQHHQFANSINHQQPLGYFDSYHMPTASIPHQSTMSLALLSAPEHSAEGNITDPSTYNDYVNLEYGQSEAFEHTTDATFDDIFTGLRQRRIEEYTPTTLEPRMTLRQYEPSTHTNIDSQPRCTDLYNDCGYEYYGLDDHSPLDASNSYQEICPWPDSPSLSETTLSSSLCKQVSEDEETMDKPYARLIYEALLQAPGHRMMLRDIYEWFLKNTTKPRESGSNGWQNSIRHNLSMNQAFENDKSTLSGSKGHSRKFNSVWILTEDAVKHGVQSTTRYRKPGPIKKGTASRVHAVQRQRSGARGGQAASRSVARSRKQDELLKFAEACSSANDMSTTHQGVIDLEEYMLDQSPQYEYRPATPANDSIFQPLYTLPAAPDGFDHEQFFKCEQIEQNELLEHDAQFNQYVFEQCPTPNCDRVSKIEAE